MTIKGCEVLEYTNSAVTNTAGAVKLKISDANHCLSTPRQLQFSYSSPPPSLSRNNHLNVTRPWPARARRSAAANAFSAGSSPIESTPSVRTACRVSQSMTGIGFEIGHFRVHHPPQILTRTRRTYTSPRASNIAAFLHSFLSQGSVKSR